MTAPLFDPAAAERRLGPVAVAAIRQCVADSPPLRVEQREALRAIFASVPRTNNQREKRAA